MINFDFSTSSLSAGASTSSNNTNGHKSLTIYGTAPNNINSFGVEYSQDNSNWYEIDKLLVINNQFRISMVSLPKYIRFKNNSNQTDSTSKIFLEFNS